MNAPPVDERRGRLAVNVVETATDQREALRGQVDDRRREVDAAVEPRLHRVLVGRQHVGEMVGLQRAQMRRDRLAENAVVLALAQDDQADAGRRQRRGDAAERKTLQQRATIGDRHRRRHHAVDLGAERRGHGKAERRSAQRLFHLARGGKLGSASLTLRDMRFDLARVAGVEFAVGQRVNENACFLAGHDPFSSASQASRKSPRARASRDITVPTGVPVTSAISR